MTTTAPQPRPVERRAVLAPRDAEPAPEPVLARASTGAKASSAVAWIDGIFYASVSVFVASLVAYFLMN